MDACLAGVDGKESFDQGSDGIRIPESAVVAKAARNGGDLKLTIDTNLQYFSQQVLETAVKNERADYGTAIVIEVKTGRLLVAAEAPTVDPNNPGAAKERDRQTKIFTESFEPGSTMKMITAAKAANAKVLLIGMRIFVATPPEGFTSPATVLPMQIFLWSDEIDRGFVERTSAAIIVLLVFLLTMNGLAIYLRNKFEKRW